VADGLRFATPLHSHTLVRRRTGRHFMTITVPLNYYDYLKKRCNSLFAYAGMEVAELKEMGATGPFLDLNESSVHGKDYLELETKEYIKYKLSVAIERLGESKVMEMLPELIQRDPHIKREIDQTLYAFAMNYTTAVNFEFFDRKTFYITSNLYEHLSQTSIDMDCGLAKLPFLSCLFVYDSPQAIELLYQIDKKPPPTYEGAVSVFISEAISEKERNFFLHIVHSDMQNVYTAIKRQLLLRDGWTLEQVLRTDWLKINPDLANGDATNDEVFYTSGLNFFRSVINTILYLGTSNPDLVEQVSPHPEMESQLARATSREKRKEIKRIMKKVSHTNYIVVGHYIPKLLPRDEHESQKRRELNVRFIVRGHWRNQPCGPENSLRRMIWIKPYYKGPEISQVIKNRPYIVK
jgi:hypothetical protein